MLYAMMGVVVKTVSGGRTAGTSYSKSPTGGRNGSSIQEASICEYYYN